MNCPYCNKEMQLKYLNGSIKEFYLTNEKKAFSPIYDGAIPLAYKNPYFGDGVEAYYCPDCHKAIIDVKYDNYPEETLNQDNKMGKLFKKKK